ncbi:MAG TPA: response regulator transcription factor [Geminicoccaceae bacterium]|nr:response regulator transcription factor [Geminicoccaceae bacterium]
MTTIGGANGEARHILVVDDDARLRRLLQRYLAEHGYHVTTAADAAEAKGALKNFAFDLMVLDVMMPGQDGVSLTTELRKVIELPILLLTALGETEDRVNGLAAGADDYLVKPFDPRELLLRIATILRRVSPASPSDQPLRFGPFAFDARCQELRRGEQRIHLTDAELSLLQILAEQPGLAISRRELGQRSRISGSDRAIDTQIARLRRKLEPDPRRPRYLLTKRGEGYVLRPGS